MGSVQTQHKSSYRQYNTSQQTRIFKNSLQAGTVGYRPPISILSLRIKQNNFESELILSSI